MDEHKKAAAKAMKLLLQQDRTEKNLRERLEKAGYQKDAVAYAIEYVKGFGYVDDARYATNYVSYHKSEKSRMELQQKLLQRGVPSDIIREVLQDYGREDEQTAVRLLLKKKLKGRTLSEMEYAEKNKVAAYLARKGYSGSVIRQAMAEECRWEE